MYIFLVGINGFIGKSLYISLLKNKFNVIGVSHHELDILKQIKSDDILINCSGINRANNESDYINGNTIFINDILNKIQNISPYFIHISSIMINGFKDTPINELPLYQQYFINSKLNSEKILLENYDTNKLCIIRPSNVFGYLCQPYYNNIIVSLLEDKLTNNSKINNLNSNCYRNFISIDTLISFILNIIDTKQYGIFDVQTNKSYSLNEIANIIYNNNIPSHINIISDKQSINNPGTYNHIIDEDISFEINKCVGNMSILKEIYKNIVITDVKELIQDRGNMYEISALASNRTYIITINPLQIRGNHYHESQIEDFFIEDGDVLFLLSHKNNPLITVPLIMHKNQSIKINPNIIHTLINISNEKICRIIINSTQKYIDNKTPDTIYISNIA